MIKAIVFDCFGVLTSDGWLPYKQKFFKDDPEKLAEATRLNRLSDSGNLPYKQLIVMIAEMAGATTEETDRAFHTNVANEQIFEQIEILKDDYKIGMLSNVSSNWLQDLFTSAQLGLFDEFALSYEVGHAKPHEQMYKAIAERLGVELHECVFIDDQQSYVAAAVGLGMQGIHFSDNNQLLDELSELLKNQSV